MELAPLIRDLAVILTTAGLVSLLFQRIRQPVVLGYLVAGIIVGPHTPPFSWVTDRHGTEIWAELGVIFLMFSLGLEFSFKRLQSVGWTAAFTGPFEALVVLALGFGTGRLLGWSAMDSVFLGAILSISSTAIIIKALDELGLKRAQFAEVIFGVLVVEDLVGILILVGLTSFAGSGELSAGLLVWTVVKLALVVTGWILGGLWLIPRLINYIGRTSNDETLTITALGLCLSLVVFADYFHYSPALAAFIMGSILAESSQAHRIEKLVQPPRDVFAAIFFVSIGMLLNPHDIATHGGAILLISLVTIFGKILSTAVGARWSGQSLRTSLQVGFALAQIGEFSFIIASLGLSLGLMSDFLYPIAVSVSVLTTFMTPYLMRLADPVATWLERKPAPAEAA